MDQFEYTYPVEELDNVIEKITKGITPMGLTKDFMEEVKLRKMELDQDSMDADEYEEYEKKKEDRIKEQIEKKRREATKRDVIIIKLTDAQREELRDEMSSSIVRKDPNLAYHKSDDEIYESEERRIIMHKLSRIKNCYYNQQDYVAAIKIIHEAIEYSLRTDYPWMTYQEAVRDFNAGKIKFAFCHIPKLYINWNTVITDPEILRGVVTGEVTLKSKKDEEIKRKRIRKEDMVACDWDYNITSAAAFEHMSKLQQQGYDTPIAPMLKAKNSSFNRYALPANNRFFIDRTKKSNIPQTFDWMHEGAGEEYYNIEHNIKPSLSDTMRMINEANGGNLNPTTSTNASNFLRALKNNGSINSDPIITPLSVNERAVELEKSILMNMKLNNPHL